MTAATTTRAFQARGTDTEGRSRGGAARPRAARRRRARARPRRGRSSSGRSRPSATASASPRRWATRCSRTSPPTVAPGIDVVFLDTGYHFAETIGTRDAVEATLPVNLLSITPGPERRGAGRDVRQGPLRPRPRPVLRAAQGPAAAGGARPGTTRGPPACAGPRPTTGSSRRSSAGTPRRRRSRSPRSPGGATRRSSATSAEQRRAGQPAAVRRLPLDRLRPLHPPGRAGRGPAQRPLGRDRPRRSAGSTPDPEHDGGGHRRPAGRQLNTASTTDDDRRERTERRLSHDRTRPGGPGPRQP